jgi:hypothetical protein
MARMPSLRIKGALEVAADEIVLAFGGVPLEAAPTTDRLAEVEVLLGREGTGLETLSRKQLKVVPYIIWGSRPEWQSNVPFLKAYLSKVAESWRGSIRHLWRHYVLNFDEHSPATRYLAAWLRTYQDSMSEPMRHLSDKYNLLAVDVASDALADATLRGGDLLEDFGRVGLGFEVLRTSSLMVSILAAAGRALSRELAVSNVPAKLASLLGGSPADAIRGATCGEKLRQDATRSLVDGLVMWQQKTDPDDAAPEPTVDFLLALNGDPRFVRERWHRKVASDSIVAVERWLSRKTIEAFFRVIDRLKTDRPDMWRARRAFWLSYLPYVSRAWLVVGPGAMPLAKKEGLRFGRFVRAGTLNNHCGLLLQIRSACVMEMNMNGSAIIWTAGAKNLPGPYAETYDRSLYRESGDNRDVFVLSHNSGWEQKFKNRLMQMTGIDVR